MIDRGHALPVKRQAELVGISRGNVYYLGRAVTAADQWLMKRIDALNLEHPFLGPRLVDCCQALLSLQGKTASQIFGDPDDLKLRSSMTLFALAEGPGSLFEEVLARYFGGGKDRLTLEFLGLED